MMLANLQGPSVALRVAAIAVLWLGVISLLHAYLNGERRTSTRVKMGYMPVIANLAAPVVDYVTKGKDVYFEAVKFGSFAEMAEAFRAGHIQVAFIIAPLAIALHQQGVPLKVVYIGNRHESTLVVRNGIPGKELQDLAGKTIAVPIRFSGHLLALKRSLRELGLDDQLIRTVEVPPPDMPVALSTGGIDGYFVGEPFASKSLYGGTGMRFLDAESIWPKFICNLVIVREDLVRNHPERVQELVTASVRSGFWAQDHIDEAIRLVSQYWGQDPEVVRYVFSQSPGRVRFDLYAPQTAELEEIGREMQLAGFVTEDPNLSAMVDDRFARRVQSTPVSSVQDILPQR